MDNIIARKCFATLILDKEYLGDKEYNLPPLVSCRVLVDGWWKADLYAETKEEAVEKFNSGNW